MSAQTSDRLSGIAARYASITAEQLAARTSCAEFREQTASELRSMAASLLRQDETKGLRKLLRKVTRR